MLFYYASLSSDMSNACMLFGAVAVFNQIWQICLIFQEKDKRVTCVLSLATMVELVGKPYFRFLIIVQLSRKFRIFTFGITGFLYALVEDKI